VSHASVALYQRLRRSPTVAELAAEVGLTDEEVLEALECSQAYTTVPLDNGLPPGCRLPGRAGTALDSAAAMEGVEYRAALRPLLDGLADRDKLIILRRFFEHRTQSEIATELGISQVQVSRLLTRTLAYLRARLGE
jgi:RNA polymerase sigma-B factor